MWLLWGLFLSINLFSLQGRAQSETRQVSTTNSPCPGFDFREALGPIRNQKDKGWCYGFAAAEVASYHAGKLISATDINITYGDQRTQELSKPDLRMGVTLSELVQKAFDPDPVSPGTHHGGHGALALWYNLNKGFCPDENMPSIDNEALETGFLHDSFQQVERLTQYPPNKLCETDLRSAQSIFDGIPIKDLENIVAHSTWRNVLPKLADRACDRINLSKSHLLQYCQDRKTCGQEMQGQFSEKTGPVYISVDMNPFINEEGFLNWFGKPEPALHAMALVGQRWDGKKCQWIVKNSWGETCDHYLNQPNHFVCEKPGYLIVDRDFLSPKIRSTAWLEKR